MLGSTTSKTFDEVQTELKQVKGPDLLENKDKKVTVNEFKFVDKLNIYFQCQIKYCNKTMPHNITANIITCPSCGATQKTNESHVCKTLCRCGWHWNLVPCIHRCLERPHVQRQARIKPNIWSNIRSFTFSRKCHNASGWIIQLCKKHCKAWTTWMNITNSNKWYKYYSFSFNMNIKSLA